MILVTGANGTVGSEVIRALVARGAPVRALVRAPEKAAGLAEQGVEVAIGDLEDRASLSAALVDVDRAFLVTSIPPNQVEIQGNFVEAASAAGVEHIAKLSVYRCSHDLPVEFVQWHSQTEQLIEDSGMEWTHIRPNNFFQNLHFSADSIRNDGVFYGTSGDVRISSIDVRDIGAVTATVLTEPGHGRSSLELTGPAGLTQPEIASALAGARGAPVEYVDLPVETLVEGMVRAGIPEYLAVDLGCLYRTFTDETHGVVTSTVEDVTGTPPRSIADFAGDHAAAFS